MKKIRLFIAFALVAVLSTVAFNSCGFSNSDGGDDVYYLCKFADYSTHGLDNMAAIHKAYDEAFAKNNIPMKMSADYISKAGTIDSRIKAACAQAEETIQKEGLSYVSDEFYTVKVCRFTASHTSNVDIYGKTYGNPKE